MSGRKLVRLAGNVHIYGVLAVYAIICMFPMLWMLYTALQPDTGEFSYIFSAFSPTLENFAKVLTRDAFSKFLLNSVIISTAVVLVTVPIGAMAGYAFARFMFRSKSNLFFFVLSTRMGPPVAVAVPIFILMLNFGILDSKLGMILLYTFMNLGLSIWMSRGFFEDLPREVEDAAKLDGLDDWGVLWRIAVPMVMGGLMATAILIFLFTWNEYFLASVLTRMDAKPFTVHLSSYFGNRRILWGPLAAASFLGSIVPITLAILARRYLVDIFTFGIVKGKR